MRAVSFFGPAGREGAAEGIAACCDAAAARGSGDPAMGDVRGRSGAGDGVELPVAGRGGGVYVGGRTGFAGAAGTGGLDIGGRGAEPVPGTGRGGTERGGAAGGRDGRFIRVVSRPGEPAAGAVGGGGSVMRTVSFLGCCKSAIECPPNCYQNLPEFSELVIRQLNVEHKNPQVSATANDLVTTP